MTSGATQIDQAAVGQQNDGMAFGEKVLINLRFNIDPLNAGIMLEFVHLYFIVEVTYVTDDSIVFHLAHVVYGDDIAIAGGSNVNIAFVEAFFDGFTSKPSMAACKAQMGSISVTITLDP